MLLVARSLIRSERREYVAGMAAMANTFLIASLMAVQASQGSLHVGLSSAYASTSRSSRSVPLGNIYHLCEWFMPPRYTPARMRIAPVRSCALITSWSTSAPKKVETTGVT